MSDFNNSVDPSGIPAEDRKQADMTRKRGKIIAGIVAAVLIVLASLAVLITQMIIPKFLIPHHDYKEAQALLEAGEYDAAAAAFQALEGYKDSSEKVLAVTYAKASALLDRGDIPAAAMMFYSIRDYEDARQRSMDLWGRIVNRETLSAGVFHTVAVKTDGTAMAVGDNNAGQCDVSDWNDMIAVSAGGSHTVGLKADGTVVAVGDNQFNQCDVEDWRDIVAISARSSHTVGLKADGTVVATGQNNCDQCNVSGWKDIVSISA